VFGEVCWEGGVVVLLGGAMGATTVGEWLARLVEQEVLAIRPDSRFPGQRELAFRHSLLREGAYATLTEHDNRLGHRLAGDWLERRGEADPMALAGHFERGGDGARAARLYLRASEQAFLVLDPAATMARANLGLGCAPPEELRLALLGMRCEAATSDLHLINTVMDAAEELMRAAPHASVPWSQGISAYLSGALLAGKIAELLAAVALLRDVDPAPEAVGKVVMSLLNGILILDTLGYVPDGTALEQRFHAVVRSAGERALMTQFWWNVAIGMRAAYAHEDPWSGLTHSDAIRAAFEVTGGELMYLNLQLFRGLNLWYLGAYDAAELALSGIAVADDALGVASYLRRLGLAWVRADRGALDDARELATQLRDHGQAQHNSLEEGRGRWVLAEVLRRMGDLEGAERELPVALAMAVPLEHPAILGTLAALRLAQGRADEALAAAQDAVARCTAITGCGMFRGAFVRLTHAEALHATGAHDAARHAIADARARLFAIADTIGDPVHKASFVEAVPENARTLALARAWLT
jgi:tetratricopeptide (TPR) repeat protein